VRLSYAWSSTQTRFDERGERIGLEAPGRPPRDTEYRDREFRIYGEYGIIERLTAYGSFAYKRLRLLEPTAFVRSGIIAETIHRTSGIGDVYVGGRYRILNSRIPVSVAGEFKIPGGYSTSTSPSLGTGRTDFTVRALGGVSMGWGYATADAGWSRRGGSYQDEFLYSAEVGGRFLGRFYSWRGALRGRRSFGATVALSDLAVFDPNLASPRVLEFDAMLGAELAHGLDLEAGLSHIVSGRNSLAGNTFEVGVAWSRRRGPTLP